MGKVPVPEIRKDKGTIYLHFQPEMPIDHSVEAVPDEVILDIDAEGYLVGIDIIRYPEETT